jgi:hypothetical protein
MFVVFRFGDVSQAAGLSLWYFCRHPNEAADLGGAWLLSFLCLALTRGQGDRLT